MQEYYFLFALALIWTIFAAVQDLKKREVANWLNFSLIAFALAYRAFYAIQNKTPSFFLLGAAGFIIFLALGNAFYYSKIFAGGDAKLLMGFGAILPYNSYFALITLSLAFVLLLFLTGAIYSLIYSVFIAIKNKEKFKKEFSKLFKTHKPLLTISITLLALSTLLSTIDKVILIISPFLILPILFVYTKAIEKCMLVLLPADKLTEGDWLEHEIKIGKITIKSSVHGLSLNDIKLLKKHKKKILIKQGVPFVPAFLISLIITALFFLTSKFPLPSSLSSLLSLS